MRKAIILAIMPLALFGAEKSVTLFNGKNLKAFQPSPGNWVIEKNGVLTLKDRTDHKMMNQNYLWTAKSYGDFTLDLEFKVWPDTNSGVFIRTANIKDPVQTGIEIQVASQNPDKPLSRGSVAGIYDLVAPKKNMLKADGWNKMEITCKGSRVSVSLNGEKVSEADLDQWTEAGKNPDGSKNKFKKPLKDFARQGYIGFQDHGSPVSYRNIRIKELK
jgi:hypothetical protein